MGIFGIYLASAIARLLTNIWYEPYAVFKYGLKVSSFHYLKKYIGYAIVLCVTGGICCFLCNLCQFYIVVNVLLKFAICSIVPNIIFYVCYHKTDEGKYLIEIIKSVLRKI